MNHFYKEGLEQVVTKLESLREENPDELLMICTNCYEPESYCTCPHPIHWPINHLIQKLKWKL